MASAQAILNTILTILIFLTAYLFYLNSSFDTSFAELSRQQHELSSSSSVKLLDTIPHHLIPTPHNERRLIVIGDIHGMVGPLDAILEKVRFDPARDHVIATGDMISKGPDSGGVVDKLIALNASAVRGNHEDHILKARAKMDRRKRRKHIKDGRNSIFSFFSSEDGDDLSEDDDDRELTYEDEMDNSNDGDVHEQRAKARDRQVARSLRKHHIKWLRSLPVIISLEPVLPIYIVHAGLVPGLQVRKQDPWAVMNMRTLRYPKHKSLSEGNGEDQQLPLTHDDQLGLQLQLPLIPSEDSLEDGEVDDESTRKNPIPTDGRSGQLWADAWNKYQRHIPAKKRRAVIYGHDAKRGHRVGEYTFGLDSGCVVGGKLTAIVLKAGTRDGEYKHKVAQISCKKKW